MTTEDSQGTAARTGSGVTWTGTDRDDPGEPEKDELLDDGWTGPFKPPIRLYR